MIAAFLICALEKAALLIPTWLAPTWVKLELLVSKRLTPKLELPKPFPKCVLAVIEARTEFLEIAEDRAAKLLTGRVCDVVLLPVRFALVLFSAPPDPVCIESENADPPRPAGGAALFPGPLKECDCPSAIGAPRANAELFPKCALEEGAAARFTPAPLVPVPPVPEYARPLSAGIPIGRPVDTPLEPPERPFMLGLPP